jgi:membrane-bound serine protease (ClpP class)
MKKFFSIIALICAFMTAVSAADSTSVFYRIRLDKDIDKASQRLVVKGLENAQKAHADYVLLDLDTYGGAVDAADSISSAILRYDIPVVAFVNMRAVSAGALISIACDSIYMKTGSSMGAATVVDPTGAVMPDKYAQSE